MNQNYETRVGDDFVMIGNDAMVKCGVPSFTADFLEVVGWKVAEEGRPDFSITKTLSYGKHARKLGPSS